MVPYFLLIGIPLLLSLFKYKDNNSVFNKRFPLLVFFLIFIVMLSLRSVECGTDLGTYKYKFDNIQFNSNLLLFDFSIIEPGYDFFAKINKFFFNNFQFLLINCALVSVVPIMLLYLNESTNSLITMALFIAVSPFTMFFSGLRQSIAIGLGAICYYFCKHNRIIPFIIIVIIAFSFHQSAVILLCLYPLTHQRITKKWFLPLLVLYILCLKYNTKIFEVLISFNQKYESRYYISSTGAYSFLILLVLLTLYSFILPVENDEIISLRNILVFSLFIQCMAPINTVAMRLNYYFLIFVPVLIPKIIDNPKRQYFQVSKLSEYVFICFFIFWFFNEAYTGSNVLKAFPYIPFWEGI